MIWDSSFTVYEAWTAPIFILYPDYMVCYYILTSFPEYQVSHARIVVLDAWKFDRRRSSYFPVLWSCLILHVLHSYTIFLTLHVGSCYARSYYARSYGKNPIYSCCTFYNLFLYYSSSSLHVLFDSEKIRCTFWNYIQCTVYLC